MIEKNYGFVRLALASPSIIVANSRQNMHSHLALIEKANEKNVSVLVFPQLSLTGASCENLFAQKSLLDSAKENLIVLVNKTKDFSLLFSVGLPLLVDGNFYSVQAWLFQGKIIAIIPDTSNDFTKTIEIDSEVQEKKSKSMLEVKKISLSSEQREIPFGKILLQDENNPFFTLTSCFDTSLLFDYARLFPVNIFALHGKDRALVGEKKEKALLLKSFSKEGSFAVLSVSPPPSESSSEFLYSAHNLIVENGKILEESYLEENTLLIQEIDIERLAFEKAKKKNCSSHFHANSQNNVEGFYTVSLPLLENTSINSLNRFIKADVFIPEESENHEIYSQVFQTQALALSKRMKHIGCKKIILGLSGGLDSTLALIVAAKTLSLMGLDSKHILAISMPGLGTTDKTKSNAKILAKSYGVTYREISIEKAVYQHFSDIGHDGKTLDIVFENAQARERTQILMDLANMEGALLVGTGNMSELALGWTTYNGDHMSMYALNSGIPKTLVKELVRFEAEQARESAGLGSEKSAGTSEKAAGLGSGKMLKTSEKAAGLGSGNSLEISEKTSFLQRAKVLDAILSTPISPELLPAVDGNIDQKTESLIGPYILHDFFMYYLLRFGFSPKKIFFLAKQAFIVQKNEQKYSHNENLRNEIAQLQLSEKDILSWLEVFYKRFFSQQFKRSCAPDGVTIGSLSFSKSFWSMPSDASFEIWLEEIEELKKDL